MGPGRGGGARRRAEHVDRSDLRTGPVQQRDGEASTGRSAPRQLGRAEIVVPGQMVGIRELRGRKATLATHARNLSRCIDTR
jgi:hypothetical protein